MLSFFKTSVRHVLVDLQRLVGSPADHESATPDHECVPIGGSRDAVLVIDRSGSMGDTDWPPSRLGAAQEAAKAFVDQLAKVDPNACVAVVGFACNATVARKLAPVSKTVAIHRAIDGLRADGGTDLTAGLKAAMSIVQRGSNPTKQVVTLSDGFANNNETPLPFARQIRGIAVHETIGIGGSPSEVCEDLLKEIASPRPDGGKRYRFIGDRAELVTHFQQLATGIMRS